MVQRCLTRQRHRNTPRLQGLRWVGEWAVEQQVEDSCPTLGQPRGGHDCGSENYLRSEHFSGPLVCFAEYCLLLSPVDQGLAGGTWQMHTCLPRGRGRGLGAENGS